MHQSLEEALLGLGRPWAHLYISSERDMDTLVASIKDAHPSLREGIKVLRGKRMIDADRTFQEFAAALQFPYYFGNNWNAVLDCMRDLLLLPVPAHLLFISNVNRVLESHFDGFRAMIVCLRQIAVEANYPEEWYYSGMNEKPVPFNIVFHAAAYFARDAVSKLNEAGLEEVQLIRRGPDVESP